MICMMYVWRLFLKVVRAVAGRCEIFVDGGVRRGIDVVKALALGATAVFVGRPIIWGLAHNVSVSFSLLGNTPRLSLIHVTVHMLLRHIRVLHGT